MYNIGFLVYVAVGVILVILFIDAEQAYYNCDIDDLSQNFVLQDLLREWIPLVLVIWFIGGLLLTSHFPP